MFFCRIFSFVCCRSLKQTKLYAHKEIRGFLLYSGNKKNIIIYHTAAHLYIFTCNGVGPNTAFIGLLS